MTTTTPHAASITAASTISIATQRQQAVAAFLARARQLIPDPEHASDSALQATADALVSLALQRELFAPAHFPHGQGEHGQVWRLHEDADGHYALYLSTGRPGQAQPPHDHTTWAIIAGVQGVERNELYRRESTGDAARDRLIHQRTVDVAAGLAVTLTPTDVHTIEFVGDENALHLHFYGRALERMPERVVFESTAGGTSRTFAPPRNIRHALVSPQELHAALRDGQEIAVLDVRETGVFSHGHLLVASSAPLWRLPVLIADLVPRRDTRVVLVDHDENLAHEAAATLLRLGWTQLSVLAGGTQGWAAAGFEVFTGTNVPSKALGEIVEVQQHTPWIDADELQRRVDQGDDLVVVDSRTLEEFRDFTLPYSHSLPGAELVYRIGELAPRPDTLVVVNCAGRTRSIIGAQTLIEAGIPNPVVSLRDGTMAWLLTGRTLVHGRQPVLPEPGEASLARARVQARDWAERAGVRFIDSTTLQQLEADTSRTLYRFDVRTRAEYEAGHLATWRWASGGQLVQATDEYVATRGSRIVLADWDGVRALTTAAWLTRLGHWEVHVWPVEAAAPLRVGAEPQDVLLPHGRAATLAPQAAQTALQSGALLFDVDRRALFERQHIEGAFFAVPDRLEALLQAEPEGRPVLITSPDGVLAGVVAARLAQRVAGRHAVRAIAGGTQAWIAAGLPTAAGAQGVLTGDDDHWLSPYQLHDRAQRDAGFRAYLDWELALVAQLERDGQPDIAVHKPVVRA